MSDFKPLKNAGLTGAGKAAQGIMSLVFIALAARTLGVEGFGLLMIIHGLVFGSSQVLRFQSWQAILRYGAQALYGDGHKGEKSDVKRFQRLIKYTVFLDMIAAIFAVVIMQIVIVTMGEVLNIPAEFQNAARMYSLCIVFMVTRQTPLGVLRLLDRFDLIALQTLVGPAVRLCGAGYLFVFGGGLVEFLIVWFAAVVAAGVGVSIFALVELSRRDMLRGILRKFSNQMNPEQGVLKFILSHNVSQGFLQSISYFGIVIVGAVLGTSAAGVYKIAEQLSNVLVKPAGKFLMPAIYPDIAKLGAADQKQRRSIMILKTIAVSGGLGLVLFLVLIMAGADMIYYFAGQEYLSAYAPMVVLALAGLISVLTFPLEPLLSAAGRMKHMMIAYGLSALFYMTSMAMLLPVHGLIGAGYALMIAFVTSACVMLFSARDLIVKAPGD